MSSFQMYRRSIFVWMLLVSHLVAADPVKSSTPPQPIVAGYFAEWGVYDRKFHVADVATEHLTHLIYAFVKIENGELAIIDRYAAVEKSYPGDPPLNDGNLGVMRQFREAKRKRPQLETLVAVGGWSHSGKFSEAAASPESRIRFARSAVAFVRRHGFDGVDIDWEYPVHGGMDGNPKRAEDRERFTLLLQALRRALDDAGREDKRSYRLTTALPAADWVPEKLDLSAVAREVDWIHLMAYDLAGGWSQRTEHHSHLFPSEMDAARKRSRSIAEHVEQYLRAGVAADRLVMGVPFYGRGWTVKPGPHRGLFEPVVGPLPKGSWEPGNYDYKDIAKRFAASNEPFRDGKSRAPWRYDADSGLVVVYDDPESIAVKGTYVREKKLRGLMAWELSADREGSLLKAMADSLRKPGE